MFKELVCTYGIKLIEKLHEVFLKLHDDLFTLRDAYKNRNDHQELSTCVHKEVSHARTTHTHRFAFYGNMSSYVVLSYLDTTSVRIICLSLSEQNNDIKI